MADLGRSHHGAAVKTHFNLSPAEYEATRVGHLHDRRRHLVDDALSLRPEPPRDVLELGCGAGTLLAQLAAQYPDTRFHGVDVDDRMVAYANDHYAGPNISFNHGAVGALPDGDAFDVVYSIDVIHHFHRHLEEFRAVRRVLRHGGLWLAVEPNIWHPYVTLQQERMRRAGHDEDHLRPWAIEPLFSQAGLAVVSRSYLHLLPATTRRVPRWLASAERRLERVKCLGGSVVYRLRPR